MRKDPRKKPKGRGTKLQLDNRFEKLSYENDPEFNQNVEEEEDKPTNYQQIHPKGILNKIDSPDIGFNWGMNPYQGCEHGCIYCYARITHEYWGYNPGLDFEKQILVKPDAPSLLRERLRSKGWKGETIMLSGNTDCYQPVERKLKITRAILEVCAEHDQSLGMITKNALVTRDIDILREMAKKQLVSVSMSITSKNETLRRLLEPRTSTFRSKMKAVEELSKAGIPVNLMMAPIIPGMNSHEIMDIARIGREAGAIGFHYTTIRLSGPIRLLFEDWLEEHYPDRKNKVMNQIMGLHGGKTNGSEFGTRMKGKGNVSDIIRQQVQLARKKFSYTDQEFVLNTSLFRRRPDQLSLF